MMKLNILNTGRLLLLFIVLAFSGQQAKANISGVYGINGISSGNKCADSSSWYLWVFISDRFTLMSSCSLTSNNYVPKTGSYRVETIIRDLATTKLIEDKSTSTFTVDATKTLAQQSINAYGGDTESFTGSAVDGFIICDYLVDDAGHKYTASGGSGCNDGNVTPLPPTPQCQTHPALLTTAMISVSI
ncbi:hypothetical protein [Rahnella sp. PCH160]|uniref:hypothetical protein n=1 Tax=Rahnella sp. PCH160 TaxID=3447928 RepID=UPI0039FCC79B